MSFSHCGTDPNVQADQIDVLEKEKYFKEEQFDYIQQALRTICLRCKLSQQVSYGCSS